MLAISSLSVETTTRASHEAESAVRTAYDSNGLPAKGLKFFRGTPFDPPRAGMTISILGAVLMAFRGFDSRQVDEVKSKHPFVHS